MFDAFAILVVCALVGQAVARIIDALAKQE
jgi:hypothetical protein